MNVLDVPPDSMNFIHSELFGKKVVGRLFRNNECSVAVVYDFEGNLIDTNVFDQDGIEIEMKEEDN